MDIQEKIRMLQEQNKTYKELTETYNRLGKAYWELASAHIFEADVFRADIRFFQHLFPRKKNYREHFHAIEQAEMRKRGRDLVIEHGMKVWG